MEAVLTSAKHCSHEDVFHYDGEERFCLLAALALWLVGMGVADRCGKWAWREWL